METILTLQKVCFVYRHVACWRQTSVSAGYLVKCYDKLNKDTSAKDIRKDLNPYQWSFSITVITVDVEGVRDNVPSKRCILRSLWEKRIPYHLQTTPRDLSFLPIIQPLLSETKFRPYSARFILHLVRNSSPIKEASPLFFLEHNWKNTKPRTSKWWRRPPSSQWGAGSKSDHTTHKSDGPRSLKSWIRCNWVQVKGFKGHDWSKILSTLTSSTYLV